MSRRDCQKPEDGRDRLETGHAEEKTTREYTKLCIYRCALCANDSQDRLLELE